MLTQDQAAARLEALGNHEHDANPAAPWLARLDMLLPQQTITINKYNATKRLMVNQGGDPFDFDPSITPYTEGINDACDHPAVRIILVKGNTRSGKTVSAESMLLRNATYGPMTNVIWFMQDEDSINDYIDERGEEMLQIHKEVNEKIDWNDKRNSRKRKKIGKSLLLYRPATARALRAKAAPMIVADEIDAYVKKIRDAIMTLVTSRQEEFGSAAKAYIASHPDAGPDGGIDGALKDATLHLWWMRCLACNKAASPAREVEDQDEGHRWNWNVPQLMKLADDMPREDFLEMVKESVRIVCPHCSAEYDKDQRLALSNRGKWLQPHQRMLDNGTVVGEPRVSATMGFVIHAFMAPFVKLHETARDWAAAKLTYDATGLDTHLREVTVKKLGETFLEAKEGEQVESWKIVQARISTNYELRTIPRGVDFLTAFVDTQGDRFEVRVIGWSRTTESWLIDSYAIKQWPRANDHGAFENIDPGNKPGDWEVLNELIFARYPIADTLVTTPEGKKIPGPLTKYLRIARIAVDEAGVPGATQNARGWLSRLLANGLKDGRTVEFWRVMLTQGSPSKKAPNNYLWGMPHAVDLDDTGKALDATVYTRSPVVHLIKKIIAKRMKVSVPGPGMMHMPQNVSARLYQELTAERFVNDEWIQQGRRNETWDGWVSAEASRATLMPERPGLWDNGGPDWARQMTLAQIDNESSAPVSIFDRLSEINEGGSEE